MLDFTKMFFESFDTKSSQNINFKLAIGMLLKKCTDRIKGVPRTTCDAQLAVKK